MANTFSPRGKFGKREASVAEKRQGNEGDKEITGNGS